MTASISFPNSARSSSDLKAGFGILTSEHESTRIYCQFSKESLIMDRSNSSAAAATTPGITMMNEAGRLRLFDIAANSSAYSTETLELTVVVDNSIVEVYANDRFVMSTWVWSWYDESNEISLFHDGGAEVRFGNVTVYEGLPDAWPGRAYYVRLLSSGASGSHDRMSTRNWCSA